MQFDYPHSLSLEQARERLEILGEYLYNRHGLKINWDGNDGSFSGHYLMIAIEGKLVVGADKVHFDGKDPGMLWRKKAKSYMQKKLAAFLDPNTEPAKLPRGKKKL